MTRLTLVLWLLFPTALAAQTPPEQVFRIGTRLVAEIDLADAVRFNVRIVDRTTGLGTWVNVGVPPQIGEHYIWELPTLAPGQYQLDVQSVNSADVVSPPSVVARFQLVVFLGPPTLRITGGTP